MDLSDRRADYAAALLPLSERIIGAVHDDGPDAVQDAIDRALIMQAPPGVDPVVALVTVLAAQINPDTTTTQRLRWIQGRPPARVLIELGVPAGYATAAVS